MSEVMTEGQWRYKAAIYFGVATLHFYRDDLLPLTPQQTLGDYADANRAVVDRVCAEAKQYLAYELSSEQVGRMLRAYLAPASRLDTPTPPASQPPEPPPQAPDRVPPVASRG